MQANCPKCQNRIVIDDAKVPDRPFNVKCPKCQAIARFPGKGAAPAAAPSPDAPDSQSLEPPPLPPISSREEGEAGHALVVLPDRNLTGAVTVALSRAGYTVNSPDNPAEGVSLLEQGFDVVVTARAGDGAAQLYQKIGSLTPESRRKVFLVVVGDEFRTGDGTQAWAVLSDMVLKPSDVASADRYLRAIVAERRRVYTCFDEATKHAQEAKG